MGEGIARRGLMLILSSPSGAGKTTIAGRLLEIEPNLSMSVSATTRPPRPGEVDGRDYVFLDSETFEGLKARDGLLEWAEVFGNRYGTPRAPVEAAMAAGRDVLFDIDWQGTQQLAEKARDDVVRVFILPPTAQALEDRLRRRAQDSDEVVAKRMAGAHGEISHWDAYDYVVINRDVEESLAAVRAILTAERHRRARCMGLGDFVRDLQSEL